MIYISYFLWGIAIVYLFFGSIKYSFLLKFPQLKFIKMFKNIKTVSSKGISPFGSLSMSLSARIGVGSISGIALAIYYGGIGTIFWIWIIGIITSINSFVETYLGAKYQEKDGDVYKGGPSYYISKGLKKEFLSKVYAVVVIITYIVGFMSIQSNTISVCINKYYGVNEYIIGIVLSFVSLLVILKGVSSISSITSKLVPIMGIAYILISVFVILNNIYFVPQLLINIVKSAFNFKSFSSGFFLTFIIGMQRGIFSTESGLGTGSIATSSTSTNNKIGLGFIQILGIYFTVFIICTATALLIITSNYNMIEFNNINGIEITQYALYFHMGKPGIVILIFSVISFAFSTIIAGYYYGESNLKFLKKNNNKKHINFLKLFTILVLFLGSVVEASILWKLVDVFVAILAIINMYALLKFSNEVKKDYDLYRVN